MQRSKAFPLDLSRTAYSYLERPNPAVQALLEKRVTAKAQGSAPRVIDIGCGCGTNAHAFKEKTPRAFVLGVETNPQAAELARAVCDDVFAGTCEEWAAAKADSAPFDAVILADVVEHIADPIAFLRSLVGIPALKGATWIISVPNFGVWHNRARTLLGLQGYAWNGLWDRTHLRFFTRKTLLELLDYCGLEVIEEKCTASFAQSTSSVTRKLFDKGDSPTVDHMALANSKAYALYRDVVEPIETRVCALWPELLAFQIVVAARAR
jgi:2-polyprenyl-3-methyl-5-hydroxy-6-metoxy-1,4-benzoquinol methylase